MTPETQTSFARVVERIHGGAAAVAAAVLMGLSLLTFFDVVGRKLFNAPVPGTVELIEGLMALIMFGALATATHHNDHVRVEFLVNRFSETKRILLTKLSDVAVLTIMAAIAWSLGEHALFMLETGDMTPVLRLPLYPFTFGAFILVVACLVIAVARLLASAGGAEPKGGILHD